MNKTLLATLLGLLTIGYIMISAEAPQSRFEQWRKTHGKVYSAVEAIYRQRVFEENLAVIAKHNAGSHTYKMGENQFTDLTDDEFVGLYLMKGESVKIDIEESKGAYPPGPVDWAGAINPVKNQGSCGSCWTFSAVAAAESFLIITKGFKGVLAEQQLVDCNKEAGDGCNGGNSDDALDYIAKNGLVYESDYPYTAVNGECKVKRGKVFINGRGNLTGNEDKMKTAIAQYPISVSVDATNWKNYESGVFQGNCRDDFHNHAVTVVGYDVDGNWKVRNSWGTKYGEEGHIWIAKGNTCAIMTRADKAI